MQGSDRTKLLIGEDGLNTLASKSILLVGVGGVGGMTAEALIRAGIENLTIVDYDVVDITNLNRQIIALHSTIGKPKVEVLKNRLLDINPKAKITAINSKFCQEMSEELFSNNFDYVIDAIDDVVNKLLLIKTAHDKNIPIISALGSGNRIEIPCFEIVDINKTENDGLAKKIRLGLRELGIKKHTVVYTKQKRIPTQSNTIGSISYFPTVCGCVISGYVINKLLEEKWRTK